MAQADQSIQNATFPTVRADINNNLAALFSDSSGTGAPTVTVAFQDWIDTSGTDAVWKKRNAANNAWITLGTIDGNDIAFEGTLPDQSGNSGKYLSTDGTDASWAALALGATLQEFTSSGTYTPTAGKTSFLVFCTGGGGGGGGASGDFEGSGGGGGGGGGGGTGVRMYNSAEMGSTAAVTIGSAGGSSAGGNGGAGGSTILDPDGSGLTLTGAGGAGGGAGVGGSIGLGGAGGASTNSQFPTNGQKGGTGLVLVVSTSGSGTGGSSLWAGGRGAGGAGGTSPSNGSGAGTAGTAGGVFILEF